MAVLATVAVLGAPCTQDRPPVPSATEGPVDGEEDGKPRCRDRPGLGVEGFVLVKSRDQDQGEHIAVREEYRDERGRRLYYLLGILGAIGEGLPTVARLELADGTPAVLLGTARTSTWILFWEGRFPCPQMAVVGNGITRSDFVDLLVQSGILGARAVEAILPAGLTEWVAVFRTAADLNKLDADTDALLQLAPHNLIVGPVDCHEGLSGRLGVPPGSYFSGVVGESRQEVERAATAAAESPRFREKPLLVDEFTVVCLAD